LTRPENVQWIRIKGSGLYQGDLGIIDNYISDERIYVKLIPRYDTASLKPRAKGDKGAK